MAGSWPQARSISAGSGARSNPPRERRCCWPGARCGLAVGRVLGPALRRVLPVLLAAVDTEVLHVVAEQQPVDAALSGAVGAVDLVVVADEHAQHEVVGAAVLRERGAAG